MKRLFTALFAIGTIAVLAIAVTAWAKPGGKSGHHGGKTIAVIEHADTDVTTDTGAIGDSVGDLLTFANDVFDRTDTRKVGTDQGYCVRTVAGAAYECNFTVLLDRGNITVEGPFYDAKDSVLSITGGTGAYRKARGDMDLKARANGTKFLFVFHLSH
jgi:allene oxide cyclase